MRRQLVPRAEFTLICLMGVGFLLVLQPWSYPCYRVGLILVLGATLLNIAVGNLPRNATPVRALLLTTLILAVVAAVFVIGILLVPVFAQMGQSE
jgi:hypothetical protein